MSRKRWRRTFPSIGTRSRCIDASSHRSDSNYSKTSPRALERSILILLNYWYLTRISIALLGNGVIQTRRNTIYRLFSKLILFYPRWNKWIIRFDKFKKKKTFVEFDLLSIQSKTKFKRWIIRYLENIQKILTHSILSIVLIMVTVF